jgi:hypothetical protein
VIKKSLSLGDLHYPHHIDLQPFIDYGRYVKPHYLNLMGDMLDLDCISHHNKEEFKNKGFDNIKREFNGVIEKFKGILDMFRMNFPKATITMVSGNHEEWLCGFANDFPQLDEKIDRSSSKKTLENLLETKKHGVNVLPFGEAFNIGKLYFRHGHEYGSSHPAKQAVMHSHKSIAIWHHHTRQTHTTYSDIGSDEYAGFAVPCYCTKAMKYGKGKPNRWTNGFLWGSHKEGSGNFTAGIITTSSKGHFMTTNGEEYC